MKGEFHQVNLEREVYMEQKHFMDISRIKFDDEMNFGNVNGFEPGDMIQISEKIDFSNSSFRYDVETKSLVAFSRKKTLDYVNTLNGFWNYVQSLNAEEYSDTPNYVVFGEWAGTPHTVKYRPEILKHMYVYDIYDVDLPGYLPQTEVKKFCERHNLTYINVLYEGEFISWEHCKSFIGKSAYGDTMEGVVIKNQTKLNDPNSRTPFVLKIINDRFSEIKKENHIRKVEDPQKLQQKAHDQEIVDILVTKQRIEKELYKMRDEGLLPEKLQPSDMRIVAQNLPKRVYADLIKEETDSMAKLEAGEFFGKLCGNQCMKFAREIICG